MINTKVVKNCRADKDIIESLVGVETVELQLTEHLCKDNYLPDTVQVVGLRPTMVNGQELTVANFNDDINSDAVAYLFNVCKYYYEKQGLMPYIVLTMDCRAVLNRVYAFLTTLETYNILYDIKPAFIIENSSPWSGKLFNNGFYKEPVKFVSLCLQIDKSVPICNMLNITNMQKTISLLQNLGTDTFSFDSYIDIYMSTCRAVWVNNDSYSNSDMKGMAIGLTKLLKRVKYMVVNDKDILLTFQLIQGM